MDVTPRVSFSTWSFRVEAPPDADDQFRQGARRGWMSPYDLRAGRRGATVEAGTGASGMVAEAVEETGSRRFATGSRERGAAWGADAAGALGNACEVVRRRVSAVERCSCW